MKYLVTGGAGFIGSAFIRHQINNTANDILNIDRLTYAGNLDSLDEISSSSNYNFQNIDICNLQKVKEAIFDYQPDSIIHLAAESHVDRSIDDPSLFIHTNIIGTYNLLETSRLFLKSLPSDRLENFRFHHVSTDEAGEIWRPRKNHLPNTIHIYLVHHMLPPRLAQTTL